MKKLIIVLGFLFAINVCAQENTEPGWKAKLRTLITSVAGSEWSNKILGHEPRSVESKITLPEIPKQVKNNTDVSTYTKLKKEPTEFDRLPKHKKRQYDYKFIEELFKVTRMSEARDEDLSSWLNTLDQGGSREGIYQALVLDEVYGALENMEEKPSSQLLEFYPRFSEKFLNQTLNVEAIAELNLYSLKRILSEKVLDLFEYYEMRDLDAIYRWYALASSDLAKNYASFFKNPIREETSPDYHYAWAKGMPIQHIKSEFIIKLHRVMNGLQTLQ